MVIVMYLDIIKSLRIDNDLKQSEIASYLNISQNSYCQYELGRRQLPIDLLIKLYKFYGVSADYILGLK